MNMGISVDTEKQAQRGRDFVEMVLEPCFHLGSSVPLSAPVHSWYAEWQVTFHAAA